MSDQTPSAPDSPLPAAAPGGRPPAAAATRGDDPDDTGVPSVRGEASDIGKGFFAALFDISFRTFITRRLASAFYVVGLIAIGIGFLVYFVGGIIGGIDHVVQRRRRRQRLVATLILVPLLTFLAIVVLRFIIEAVVALIAIAENTQRTADNIER